MVQLIKLVKKNKFEFLLLLLIIVLAAFLRFYQINELHFFTYDQSRDAIFAKRIIADQEFRLLGTQTSIPGMYLPPFYYYTIAPILWLSGLNPVGIDIYSALIGVLTVPLIYLVANKIFGKPAGLFSASLVAVSPLLVEITRRSWNPNTLPFFILISFYFLYLYFKEGKKRDFLLAFISYGYSLSLHFAVWTLMPFFLFSWLHFLFKKSELKILVVSFLILFFFVSPLLIFEIRHHFFLVSQAKSFFVDGQRLDIDFFRILESSLSSLVALFAVLISGKVIVGHGAPLEFSGKIRDLFASSLPISVVAQRPLSISFPWWGVLIFIMILIASAITLKKNQNLKQSGLGLLLIWIWIIWGILVSRVYRGGFFFFYYLYLFPAVYLLFGFLSARVWSLNVLRPLWVIFLILITSFHLYKTTIFKKNWRDIDDLRRVSRVIAENVEDKALFNIATIRRDTDFWERNSVDYRYFVEAFGGKRALDWYPQDYEKAKTLFVVDETGRAEVLKTNIMEIQLFRPRKVIHSWGLEKGIIVYQLDKSTNDENL